MLYTSNKKISIKDCTRNSGMSTKKEKKWKKEEKRGTKIIKKWKDKIKEKSIITRMNFYQNKVRVLAWTGLQLFRCSKSTNPTNTFSRNLTICDRITSI